MNVPDARARVLISSLIVAQMLPPDTVVKGGVGVKLRLGEIGTRATRDIDVVTRDREHFLDDLNSNLHSGWGSVPPSKGALKRDSAAPPRVAFTGQARRDKQAMPPGVPPAYLMEPFKVTLSFLGTSWASVPVEVAHDEINGVEHADPRPHLADQIIAVAAVLQFGGLRPVPLISLEQQIAQKIHAVTEPNSDRAHDLVDLQLLWYAGDAPGGQGLSRPLLARLCTRTFDYRGTHVWPPTVTALPNALEPAYAIALEEADATHLPRESTANSESPLLAPTLIDAVRWLADRITEIAAADLFE